MSHEESCPARALLGLLQTEGPKFYSSAVGTVLGDRNPSHLPCEGQYSTCVAPSPFSGPSVDLRVLAVGFDVLIKLTWGRGKAWGWSRSRTPGEMGKRGQGFWPEVGQTVWDGIGDSESRRRRYH